VKWDIGLTEGYSYEVLPALFGGDRFGRITPWSVGLKAALHAFRPDAIWVHGYDRVSALRLMAHARVQGVPILVRAEVEDSDAHGGRLSRWLKDRLLRTMYRQVDGFLAIGAKNRQFYLDRSVPEHRIHSAPYAVDNVRFRSAGDAERGDAPTALPRFLFVGKLTARKRPVDAIWALHHLRERLGVDATLTIVGGGELRDECMHTIDMLQLSEHVEMLGFLNQTALASLYWSARGLLLPSERERWGLVANEAMAAGCPVIASRAVGCADDLVINFETGYVVSVGDVAGYASAMARLANSAEHSAMRRAAMAKVADYSFEKVELGLLQALDSCATS
jgi:glycosyltransferase involved in cell wall biosynthesis